MSGPSKTPITDRLLAETQRGLETYWTDRTAALAEALQTQIEDVQHYELTIEPNDSAYMELEPDGRYVLAEDVAGVAKDALLYLREHGWTLERAGD